MATKTHKALFVDKDCNIGVRTDLPLPEPNDRELFIETLYSGINPADLKHAQHLGIRSVVMGYDFCGRVLSVPAGSQFNKGDIVAGYTPTNIGRPLKYGTHQTYLCCPEDMLFKALENIPQSHAACLAVVAMTAADALFNLLKFPLPGETASSSAIQGPLLVWGASSSVGLCTIQFARAIGCRTIIVTASPKRHQLLKGLGATHCFDYASSNVITDIRSAVEAAGQGPIRYAIDAVGAENPSSAEIMTQCISKPEDAELISAVLRRSGNFRMPVAMTKDPFTVQLAGAPEPISIPSRPEDHWRAWKVLMWAVENYGEKFRLPSVEVYEGAAQGALEEVRKVSEEGRGFGKRAIRHPMM